MIARIIFISIFVTLYSTSILAQDLIVTIQNDSINCRITKYKDSYIYFTYKNGDDYRSTLLSQDQVEKRELGFFKVDLIPKEKIIGYEEYQKFRFGLDFGISYRLAQPSEELPSEFHEYAKDLKRGFYLGGEFSYFFHRKIGFGVKSDWTKSSNSMNNIYIEDEDGNREYGVMRDKISIVYVGPHLLFRHTYDRNDNVFLFGVGMGYMSYKNDAVVIESFITTGNTTGLTIDFMYDIALNKNSAISFRASMLSGSLFEIEIDDGANIEKIDLEQEQIIGLSRVDFTIGFRFGY